MDGEHEQESFSSFTMLSDGSLSNALIFRCEICANCYKNPRDLEDHAKIAHNSEFVEKDSIYIHNMEISDVVQKEVSIAPKKRKPEPVVREAKKTKVDSKNLSTLCETKFTLPQNLKRHMKNKH